MRVPVSSVTDSSAAPQLHGGLLETLLAAAAGEDELVTKLLNAQIRGDRPGLVILASAIAKHRGLSKGNAAPEAGGHPLPSTSLYENQLLSAIHREEILLDSIAAASARGEQPKLFSLCRKLCDNRKRFDAEFRRELQMSSQPEPFDFP